MDRDEAAPAGDDRAADVVTERGFTKTFVVPCVGGGTREVTKSFLFEEMTALDAWFILPKLRIDAGMNEDISDLAALFATSLLITEDVRAAVDRDTNEIIRRAQERLGIEDICYGDVALQMKQDALRWWETPPSSREEVGERFLLSRAYLLFTQNSIIEAMNTILDLLLAIHLVRVGHDPIATFGGLPETVRNLPIDRPEDIARPDILDAALDMFGTWTEELMIGLGRTLLGLATHPRELVIRLREQLPAVADDPKKTAIIEKLITLTQRSPALHQRYEPGFPRDTAERRLLRRGRRVFRRSLDTHARLFPRRTADLRSFLRGEVMFVRGIRYDYRLIKTWSAVEHSISQDGMHVPFALSMYRKDGKRIGTACIFFRDTPMVDQIIAMRLHVSTAEDEVEYLKQINLSCVTPAFWEDDFLRGLMEARGALPKSWEVRRETPVYDKLVLVTDNENEPKNPSGFADLKRQVFPLVRDAIWRKLPMSRPTFDFLCDPGITSDDIRAGVSDERIDKMLNQFSAIGMDVDL